MPCSPLLRFRCRWNFFFFFRIGESGSLSFGLGSALVSIIVVGLDDLRFSGSLDIAVASWLFYKSRGRIIL